MAEKKKEFLSLRRGGGDIEIVACIYLDGEKIAFVDRLNCTLLIANKDDDEITRIPLITTVVGPARPSDINKGTGDGTLLVTFTDDDPNNGSKVVHYRLNHHSKTLEEEWSIGLKDRTKSAALLDNDYVVATFQWKVRVYDRRDGKEVSNKDRTKRDKGGLITVNRVDRSFYYGDGNTFVWCQFDANNRRILDKFRYNAADVKFPRGSAILENGDILVCCDDSKRIVRISSDGRRHDVVVTGGNFGFGDVDYDENRREFMVTRWPMKKQQEKVLPILYRFK